jgi:ABC-2 type transport system ATP-binding protein
MNQNFPDLALRVEGFVKQFKPGLGEPPIAPIGPISFEVPRGEICALLGPNGAGKSTSIKALLGLVRPSSGSTFILGHPTPSDSWRGRVGYLPEQARIHEHLTAAEALAYLGRLQGLSASVIDQRSASLLGRLDLPPRRLVRSFSKGMQQRVSIAQALLAAPELLVLDEPMSGLDPIGRKLVRDLMLEEKARGATILFSTHIIPDAEALSDRATIIAKGRLVATGSLDELMGKAELFDVTYVPRGGTSVDLGDRPQRVRGEAREVGASPDDLEDVLRAIRAAGGRLITVEPVRKSLESHFQIPTS